MRTKTLRNITVTITLNEHHLRLLLRIVLTLLLGAGATLYYQHGGDPSGLFRG